MKRTLRTIGDLSLYFLFFLIVIFGVSRLVKLVIGSRPEDIDSRVDLLVPGFIIVLAFLITNLLYYRIRRDKLVWHGWPEWLPSLTGFGKGCLIAFVMIVLILGGTMLMGGGEFELVDGTVSEYMLYVLTALGAMFVMVLGEEWLFRGYLLVKLADRMGIYRANVVVALLFAGFHMTNEGSSFLVAINIFLGSYLVGVLRFTDGGLPVAWGFHFAWNGAQLIAGSVISGEVFPVPMIRFVSRENSIVSGGLFGPEGGIAATAITAVAIFLLLRVFRNKPAFTVYLDRQTAP